MRKARKDLWNRSKRALLWSVKRVEPYLTNHVCRSPIWTTRFHSAFGTSKLWRTKVDLDPTGIRESIALWRDAVDLKLDMRANIRSHLIVMHAKILGERPVRPS